MVGAPEAFIEINCACGGAKHGGPSEMASSQQCAIPARASIRTISIAFSTLSGVGWDTANEPHSSVFQFTLPRLENELMNSDCR
jgi:hypothetical protein